MATTVVDPYSGITYFNNSFSRLPLPFLDSLNLTGWEMLRITQEIDAWKYYNGNHWTYQRPDGEPQITINFCRAFVDKSVAFLMGKGFGINVKPEAEEITKPVLDYVWEDNQKDFLALEVAQMGGVTGNAFVKVAMQAYDPDEDPELYEMYPQGRIRLILLPSGSVFPRWDGHDRNKMVEVRIAYRIAIEEGYKVREAIYKEIITNKRVQCFIDDTIIMDEPNPLNEIPVVCIKNITQAGYSLGRGDLYDLIPLQKELNYKATDISDIINYHGAPITIIKGAKASQLEKGARKIWGGLPKDATVENLELQSDLAASINYWNLIKTALFELANMPENAFQGDENISNTSGIAMHMQMQPLMDLTHAKQLTYGLGIQQINRLILKTARYMELDELDAAKFDGLKPYSRYWTETKFPDPLPKDILIQLQVIAQKLQLGLESRLGALQELGEEDAAGKLEEILEEMKNEQDMTYLQGAEGALNTNIGGIVHQTEKAKQPKIENTMGGSAGPRVQVSPVGGLDNATSY